MYRVILIGWMVLVLSGSGMGAIYTVDDDGPANFSSIQAAINACNHGDRVIVSRGTYCENVHFQNKNITLTSTDPDSTHPLPPVNKNPFGAQGASSYAATINRRSLTLVPVGPVRIKSSRASKKR